MESPTSRDHTCSDLQPDQYSHPSTSSLSEGCQGHYTSLSAQCDSLHLTDSSVESTAEPIDGRVASGSDGDENEYLHSTTFSHYEERQGQYASLYTQYDSLYSTTPLPANSGEPGVGDVTCGDSGDVSSVHPSTVCNTNPLAAAVKDMYLAVISVNNFDILPVESSTASEQVGHGRASSSVLYHEVAYSSVTPVEDDDYDTIADDQQPTESPVTATEADSDVNILYETSSQSSQSQTNSSNIQALSNKYHELHSKCGSWILVSILMVATAIVATLLIRSQLLMKGRATHSKHSHSRSVALLSSAQHVLIINVTDKINYQEISRLSVLNGQILLGGPSSKQLFVYDVTNGSRAAVVQTEESLTKPILIGHNCLAGFRENEIQVQSYQSDDQSHRHTFVDIDDLSYVSTENTIYVTDYVNGTYMSIDGGYTWKHVFRYDDKVAEYNQMSTIKSSTSSNSNLIFWSVEIVKRDFMPLYQFVTYRLLANGDTFDITERATVELPQPMTLNPKLLAELVDDGKGNLLFTQHEDDNLHWFWIDKTYHSQYGGILNFSTKVNAYRTFAMDTDTGLLYLAHADRISVFRLIYE